MYKASCGIAATKEYVHVNTLWYNSSEISSKFLGFLSVFSCRTTLEISKKILISDQVVRLYSQTFHRFCQPRLEIRENKSLHHDRKWEVYRFRSVYFQHFRTLYKNFTKLEYQDASFFYLYLAAGPQTSVSMRSSMHESSCGNEKMPHKYFVKLYSSFLTIISEKF